MHRYALYVLICKSLQPMLGNLLILSINFATTAD